MAKTTPASFFIGRNAVDRKLGALTAGSGNSSGEEG
jgi:hypothetical protein